MHNAIAINNLTFTRKQFLCVPAIDRVDVIGVVPPLVDNAVVVEMLEGAEGENPLAVVRFFTSLVSRGKIQIYELHLFNCNLLLPTF